MGYRTGPNKQGWEQSDFPILCGTCLGENPYIRMTKSEFARECKVCVRPFTVFRWKPGSDSRYKKTEICQTCAKLKNVCQTCLFDLDFGLPVELRDKFIEQNSLIAMPKDMTNRDFWANNVNADIDKLELPYKDPKVQSALGDIAQQFGPSVKRNKPKVCTFYIRGLCNRGTLCPYRHEDINDEDLESLKKGVNIDKRIRERFHGINDPIAKKILDKVKETNIPKEPEDPNITTLFLGNLDSTATEAEIKKQLEVYGKIKAIKMVSKQNCAFACFFARESAAQAMEFLYDRFFLSGDETKKIKLLWAKSQLEAPQHKTKHHQPKVEVVPVEEFVFEEVKQDEPQKVNIAEQI